MTNLRASTLAEMLFVIVITGIVLACVIDGLGLFGRTASSLSGRLVENGRFRESYTRLEELVASSDSLTDHEGRVTAWRGGNPGVVLYQRDSLLLALVARQTDTLFSGVVSLALFPADSLSLVLARRGEAVRITFPIAAPDHIQNLLTIGQTEDGYEYD